EGGIEAVLLDRRLPDATGFEAVDRVVAGFPDIPVVVMTSYDRTLAADALGRGAQDYIIKGEVNPTLLSRALTYALMRKSAEVALRRSDARFRAAVEGSLDAVGILSAVRDRSGRVTDFVVVDIHHNAERRPGRARDTAARDEQEGGLRRREEQLRQSQKMEAIGRLAGGVAHDFNNLLTVIRGHGELVLRRLEEEHPLRRNLQEIGLAAERASALTHQLLAFSRKQVLQPRTLDLAEVLDRMESLLQRMIGEDVELVTRRRGALGSVRADPAQMEQIIVNLAVNARDAMPQGGVLTIELANAELDEPYARDHP